MTSGTDMINHPPHYAGARWESIEIIEALGNQFRLGNALKYIFRHKKKGGDEDLKKARWYLEREFAQDQPTKSDGVDFRLWSNHGHEFAASFGIDEFDLAHAVSAIADACVSANEHDKRRWREDVHKAMGHLNAYLLRHAKAEIEVAS